jgi:hypothetical protein
MHGLSRVHLFFNEGAGHRLSVLQCRIWDGYGKASQPERELAYQVNKRLAAAVGRLPAQKCARRCQSGAKRARFLSIYATTSDAPLPGHNVRFKSKFTEKPKVALLPQAGSLSGCRTNRRPLGDVRVHPGMPLKFVLE